MIGQLNPTQLSSRLAAMSDQQLQQYAMMHHDDPFVMAIAMDVKNQRDALRSSAAMPQQQQQPTVVQQLISRMAQLPPMQGGQGQQMPAQQLAQPPAPAAGAPASAADGGLMSGVAALPARNLAKMKEGGIAGYADEGLVKDFLAKEAEQVAAMTPEERKAYYQEKAAKRDFSKGVTSTEVPAAAAAAEEGALTRGVRPVMQGLGSFLKKAGKAAGPLQFASELLGTSDEDMRVLMAADAQRKAEATGMPVAAGTGLYGGTPAGGRPTMANDPRLMNAQAAADVQAAANVAPPAPTAPGVPGAPRPAGPRPSATPTTPQGGIADLMGPPQPDRIDRLLSQYKPASPEELIASAKRISDPWNKEIEEANKPFKEQLAAERARLTKNEDQNKWQAVMETGLAMMASRSPYVFQAFGEAGLQGLKMYQQAKAQDDAARKALMHSEMLMAQAERAERSGNRRDAVQLAQTAEGEKKIALQFGLQAEQIRSTDAYHKGVLAVNNRLADLKGREVAVHETRAASETSKIAQAVKAADLAFDNDMKAYATNKMSAMQLTPEVASALRLRRLHEAYRQYGLDTSTLPALPSSAGSSGAASLVFNPQTGKIEPSR